MPFKKPHHSSDKNFIIKEGDMFVILPRGLNIVWGNDSRYWKLPEQGSAELIQVSWLEVSGMVSVQSGKKYKVEFEVKVKNDGFGWDGTDVLVMAKLGKSGRYKYEVTHLRTNQHVTVSLEVQVDALQSSSDLHFGLYEVWSGRWKGGLEIIKAVVAPV